MVKHELTSLEIRILLGAAADLKRLRSGKPANGTTRYAFQLREQIADAKHGYVRLAASRWLGEALNAAGRMAVSRAIGRLEGRGLAKRAALHWAQERANCLWLSEEGLRLARKLKRRDKAVDA